MVFWIRWASLFNPFRFGYQLLGHIIFEFGPKEYECESSSGSVDPLLEAACSDGGGVVSWRKALKAYDMTATPGTCVIALCVFWAVAHVLAYAFLRYRCHGWLE